MEEEVTEDLSRTFQNAGILNCKVITFHAPGVQI